MGYNAMWKKINKHTEKIKMEPYNSPVPIDTELNYRGMYFEVLTEKELLLEEMREYKSLEISFNQSQSSCNKTFAECERFSQVLLHHYQKLKQSEMNEKERKIKWNSERDQLKRLISTLSVQTQEKDYKIQSLNTQNEELQKRLKQEEMNQGELRTQLDIRDERIRELTEGKELIETERSIKAQELEIVQGKTINIIKQNNEQFEQYMDKVVNLHTDINNILHRCKIQANKIAAPVCTGDDQIEAMKESINQLDEVASAAINCIVRQEELKELSQENERLRDELGNKWLECRQEEGKVQTLKINIRYYRNLIKNHQEEANKYTAEKMNRTHYETYLEAKIATLTNEINMYQDQISVLEKDKLTLQENLDKARASLCSESSLLLQDKKNSLQSRLENGIEEKQLLESMIDSVKTKLRIIIPESNNCNSLKTLLNELENPCQVKWNSAVS